MNPSTSDDFAGCTVTTEVAFNSADWGPMVGGDEPGFVKWSATPPGTEATPNALGGTDAKLMQISKPKSDAVFALKKGDVLVVKGVARKNVAHQVIFHAFEVTKKAP